MKPCGLNTKNNPSSTTFAQIDKARLELNLASYDKSREIHPLQRQQILHTQNRPDASWQIIPPNKGPHHAQDTNR